MPYTRNRLKSETIRATLCLGEWSLLGFVKTADIIKATKLPDIPGDDEVEYEEGWDRIDLSAE